MCNIFVPTRLPVAAEIYQIHQLMHWPPCINLDMCNVFASVLFEVINFSFQLSIIMIYDTVRGRSTQ